MTSACTSRASESGYSLIEMMVVVGIMGILVGMAVIRIGASRPGLVGDGGMRVVLSQLNAARELAITQRRNMRVTFTLGNKVEIVREEVTNPPLTTISSVLIEGGLQFVKVANLPDSAEFFLTDGVTAVSFPTATGLPLEVKFKPDGSFVNQDGAILNGTVFVALPNQTFAAGRSTSGALSVRAVTIFGLTGRIRGYRFDGGGWKPV